MNERANVFGFAFWFGDNVRDVAFRILATMDVKRNIYDLAVNKYGSQIAIVENQGGYESIQESVVRVYGVGRMKNVEDEADDDENDMEMSDEESATENSE